jgi:hypothetical protein
MVRKGDVARRKRCDLAHCLDVPPYVPSELTIAQLRERTSINPLIVIPHVDRKHTADIGPIHRARRVANPPEDQPPRVPVPHRPHEPELIGMTLLTDEMHLMPKTHQRLGKTRVVHVGPSPAQQIPMKHQHTHHR